MREESKESEFDSNLKHVICYQDELLKVYPLPAYSDSTKLTCYSYLTVPATAPGKFNPKKATQLGCNPKQHFKLLTDG